MTKHNIPETLALLLQTESLSDSEILHSEHSSHQNPWNSTKRLILTFVVNLRANRVIPSVKFNKLTIEGSEMKKLILPVLHVLVYTFMY